MNSRLAMITVLDEGRPDNSLPVPPPGYPAHPIAPGGPPVGIWPDPGYPSHPIAPGGPPPGVWPGPGYPTHPIAPGGPPVGIWPGPGVPTPPIYYPPGVNVPGFPTHPIAPGGPGGPVGIWPSPGHPSHPIAPGGQPPTSGSTPGYPVQLPSFSPEDGGWVWSFIPGYGWGWSWIPNPNPPRPDNTLPEEGGGDEPTVTPHR
jgi:hypothetical protein